MVFAVGATFLANRLFASYSVPWAILVVIAYIFKDRIKEILRMLFMAVLPRFVADQTRKLRDPKATGPVGSTRVRVEFCRPNELPDFVLHMRNLRTHPFRAILQPENVIHVHKDTLLHCKRLAASHTRLESITEIQRLSLESWLSEMDNSASTVYYMKSDSPSALPANRVYHVMMIIRLIRHKDEKQPIMFCYRLILNRDGIVRIEDCGTYREPGLAISESV